MNASNRYVSILLILFGTFSAVLKTGNSLNCFECNSHTQEGCASKHPPKEYSKQCKDGQPFVACRKIVQTIDFEVNGLQPDNRVIRSCAYQRQELDKCYQRSGFGGRQEVCACNTDDCNSSTQAKIHFGLLASTVSAYLIRSLVRL